MTFYTDLTPISSAVLTRSPQRSCPKSWTHWRSWDPCPRQSRPWRLWNCSRLSSSTEIWTATQPWPVWHGSCGNYRRARMSRNPKNGGKISYPILLLAINVLTWMFYWRNLRNEKATKNFFFCVFFTVVYLIILLLEVKIVILKLVISSGKHYAKRVGWFLWSPNPE